MRSGRDGELQYGLPRIEIERGGSCVKSDVRIFAALIGRAARHRRKYSENQDTKEKFLHEFIRLVIVSTNDPTALRNPNARFPKNEIRNPRSEENKVQNRNRD